MKEAVGSSLSLTHMLPSLLRLFQRATRQIHHTDKRVSIAVPVHVATSAKAADEVLTRHILQHPSWPHVVLGLDVEWQPQFSADIAERPTATIQIALSTAAIILHIAHYDSVPNALKTVG